MRFRHRLFAGGWSGERVFDVVRRGEAVAVLLYDPDRDSVVLVEQFRLAALYGGRSPWQIENVAGLIDTEHETPEEVALRETREESNLEPLGDLIPIQRILPASGSFDEVIWLYCARVDSTNAAGLYGLADEHEDIRVLVKTMEEAESMWTPARSRAATHSSPSTGFCATATACAANGGRHRTEPLSRIAGRGIYPRRLLEMLRQRQPLALVGRADRAAIQPVRARDQRLVQHPADHLAVLDQKRHLARAHLQHRAAAAAVGLDRAKTGVEKPGIMHPELADKRIVRQHLGGMIRRYDDRLARRKDVKVIRVEHDPVRAPGAAMPIDRLPELARIVVIDPVYVDDIGMPARLVPDPPGVSPNIAAPKHRP